MNGAHIDIAELIESRPVGPRQMLLVALCLIVVGFDGFNAQVMGYAAPALIKAFHVEKSALGPLASAGLFGLMLGALTLGTLGDRIGRRSVILISVATFGLFSTLTGFVHGIGTMTLLRFLTGIGLGGAMPACVALVAEYAPVRRRGTMVTVAVSGFAIGPALGGFAAPSLMAHGGWPMLFLVGGIVPLLLVPLLALLLPESTRSLLSRNAGADRISANLRRVLHLKSLPAGVTYTDAHVGQRKAPVADIFREGRLLSTICLWVAIFMNLLGLNLQTNWLPLMLTDFGYPPTSAVHVTALFHVGGALGGLVLARILDRFDFSKAVPIVFVLAAVAVAAIGAVGREQGALMLAIFSAGLFVVGLQAVLNALSGLLYPAHIRSTGSGWALGIGRLGAAIGPMVGGALGGLGLARQNLFYLEAIPFLIGAGAIFLVYLQGRGRTVPDSAVAAVRAMPE